MKSFTSRFATWTLAGLIAVSVAWPTVAQTPVSGLEIHSPDSTVAGQSLGAWAAEWWQWTLSFKTGNNPAEDLTGDLCGLGQHGPVFFLATSPGVSVERSCRIAEGLDIFLPFGNSVCSTIDLPPYFAHEEDLAACAAVDSAAGAEGISVTLDGVSVADLDQFLAETPVFTLALQENNLYGLEPGVGQAVASGLQMILKAPSAGEHKVVVSAPGPEGEDVTLTYHLKIQESEVREPVPEASGTPTS